MRYENEINNDNIDHYKHGLIGKACEFLARPYRKCTDAFGQVIISLIYVFAHIDTGHT